MKFLSRIASAAFIACWVFGAHAQISPQPVPPPALHVENAWVRLLPGTLPAAGYFTLVNDSARSATLTAATSPSWHMVMMHRSRGEHGEATMSMVGSVTVPPHGQVAFAPGGYHLMLEGAHAPLAAGGQATITLHFADTTTLPVEFALKPADATGP
ncbi:MAG: copper chaperone PCu(A)C [Nevskiaceae bacterium]|nr:MAG: copper chaperone PCu(A)C [Nevskiaceae bacterium]TBR71935.1 MAG: copper chaperone PCu(A)C [Nevskiaceae bacterium]